MLTAKKITEGSVFLPNQKTNDELAQIVYDSDRGNFSEIVDSKNKALVELCKRAAESLRATKDRGYIERLRDMPYFKEERFAQSDSDEKMLEWLKIGAEGADRVSLYYFLMDVLNLNVDLLE